MLFANTIRAVSLALSEPDGRYAGSIDIHTDRWESHIPLDDAILSILAQHHRPPSTRSAWMLNPNASVFDPYHHPDFTVQPGGVFAHEGPALRDALLVTTTDTHLVLPDGRAWDRTTFSGPAFISKKAKNAHHDLLVLAQTTPQPEAAFNTYQASHQKPLLAIVLGAITTLVQHPIAPSLDTRRHLAQTAGAIAGRAAVVLSAVPRTGKAAIELAHEMAASFVQDLADAWLLRPDRQWSPNAWIISPKMDAILVHLDPLDVAFGRLAAGILVRHAPTPERWTNAFSPASAHEAMMQRTLLQALDQQVLATYAADASRLKPMAAKRARAFAKP